MPMSLVLDPGRPLGEEVRRVARAHVVRMTRALEHPQRLGMEESIHDVRKRAKKLRALTRLVRPGLHRLYKPTNGAFGDAARALSQARDAHVMLATFDALTGDVSGVGSTGALSAVREGLVERHERIHRALLGDGGDLETARSCVVKGMDLVERWRIDDDFDVIAGGIVKTCGRLGDAYRACGHDGTAEAFHEWRKCAKYHRYHLELLVAAYPEMVEPWIAQMHRLTDALGEDHDLAVFGAGVRSQPGRFGGDETAHALIVLAEDRSAELRNRALSLGARLATEDPRCVAHRLGVWWRAAANQAVAVERR